MAKKKEVVINPKSAPTDVESGDVNIMYHHTLIGSLSDDGSARLETENTICLHDIGVEYVKPQTNYTRTLTINGNDNYDWAMRIPCIFTPLEGVKTAYWRSASTDITVLTGDAVEISCIVESVAEAGGSKTHPYDVTGSCVNSYNRTNGILILNPNADTFEITIVATNE